MSLQQRRIRKALEGIENVEFCRLLSSQRTSKHRAIRGKAALAVKACGPARNPGHARLEVLTRDENGLSRWEIITRGDGADAQAALARMLR